MSQHQHLQMTDDIVPQALLEEAYNNSKKPQDYEDPTAAKSPITTKKNAKTEDTHTAKKKRQIRNQD